MDAFEYAISLVNETREYISRARKLPSNELVGFHLWEEGAEFKAKFDYGRIAHGNKIEAIIGAIANALVAIDEDVL